MTTRAVNPSPLFKARVAGVCYLITFLAVVNAQNWTEQANAR